MEHLRTQAAAGGYAEAVCLALPAPIQRAATHQESPAFRCAGGDADGRCITVDQFAESKRSAAHDGPEEFVNSLFRRQGLYQCRREEEVGREGRRRRSGCRPDTKQQVRLCQGDKHTGTRGGYLCPPLGPPPLSGVSGSASPPWAFANVAAAVLWVLAHRAQMAASTAGAGASRPSREKSSCWLSRSGSPVVAAGPSPSEAAQLQRIRRIARARQMRHGEEEVLDLDEPAKVHLVEMVVCLEPRDRWLSARRTKSVQLPYSSSPLVGPPRRPVGSGEVPLAHEPPPAAQGRMPGGSVPRP